MRESPSVRLKAATAALHQRVEDGVDILRRTETLEGTIAFLRKMEAFYRALEPILAERLRDRVPERFLTPRLPRLRSDLDALAPGWQPLPEPPMPTLVDPLGALYVLEGATLGGQIIGRHLTARLGFRSAFFGGEGVGPRWREFRALLDECEEYDAVEASTVATFLSFESAVIEPVAFEAFEVLVA